MNVLVTGASGFVGGHLVPALRARGHEVVTLDRSPDSPFIEKGVPHYAADILDVEQLTAIFGKEHPNAIIHLAAISNVPYAWEHPLDTCTINAGGTVSVIEAAHHAAPGARLLLVGSSDVSGRTAKQGAPPTEDSTPQPQNPYSITKYCAEQMAEKLAERYDMDILVTRSFNHYGPGQKPGFVVSDFARQIARIARGDQPPGLRVGDLTAMRDFTYVSDVIGAYIALVESDAPRGIYNICSGQARRMDDILARMIRIAQLDIQVEQDPAKLRPSDVPYFVGDASKLKAATHWQPQVTIEDGLAKTITSWQEP